MEPYYRYWPNYSIYDQNGFGCIFEFKDIGVNDSQRALRDLFNLSK